MIFSPAELEAHSIEHLRSASQFEAGLVSQLAKLVAMKKPVEISFATIKDQFGLSDIDGFVIQMMATASNKGYVVTKLSDRYLITL